MPQDQTRSFDIKLFLGILAFCILVSNLTILFVARDGLAYRDFKVFYSGARILRAAHGSELYNLDLQVREQTELLHIKPEEAQPLVHPPFELLLFLPLAWFSYSHAFYLWGGISIACGLVSAKIIGQELPQLMNIWWLMPSGLVVCLFPFFIVIFEGQDSAVALLLLVAAWLSFRHNADSLGGFWLGLALFRFQLFIPLAIILAFRKPQLLKGFSVAAILMGLTSLIMIHPMGVISYIYFLVGFTRVYSVGTYMNAGLVPNFRGLVNGIVSTGVREGALSHSGATWVSVVVSLISLMSLVWAAAQMLKRHGKSIKEFDLAFSLAVPTCILVSYHTLEHDLVLLAVPFAIVLDRICGCGFIRKPRSTAFIILISLFYVSAVYVLLFAWSQVYWLSVPLIVFAILISIELSDSSRDEVAMEVS